METKEVKAKAAIAMLREGLRDFDLQRVARASTELVRTGVLTANHGIELTYSTDYPTLNPEQASLGSGGVVNAFVTKVGYTSKAKIKVTPLIDFKTQILRMPSQPKTVIVRNTSKTDPVALGY